MQIRHPLRLHPTLSTSKPAPRINYRAFDNGGAAVITTDAGTLAIANGQFQIRAADGTVVGGVPLIGLRVDDISMPIDARIDGNTATLTPDPARAVYKPVALPFQESAPWKTPYEREQAAWSRMMSTISSGPRSDRLWGAVGAGALGCVAGGARGVTGGFVFLAVGAVPGALVGCLAGAAAFVPLGTLAGTLFVTGPVAIAAVIQYFTTVNAPFVPPAPK